MKELDIFQAALGLGEEWMVVKTDFNAQERRLDIYLDFTPGTLFPCPACNQPSKAYDTTERTWQHLNFFQHTTYIHARLPRVDCPTDGIKQIQVPWARERSGFTLLFEALIMAFADEMPVCSLAEMVGVHDTRIWRIIEHYVNKDVDNLNLSKVLRVGVDETSSTRGHHYVTLFVDMDTSKVVFVTKGKNADTLKAFKDHLQTHRANADQILEFSCDLSPAFISGIGQHFSKAHITFDKFHVMKLLNAAVDETRRSEQVQEKDLKSSRYVWLKNPNNLSGKERTKLDSLSCRKLKTGRAYRMKLLFQELFTYDEERAIAGLKKWYIWATHSRLEPIKAFARTLKKHWDGIVRWFKTNLTNGILEGLNSLVQAAKARARGYRSVEYFKLMIYMVAGKMGRLPT
jgi:transposase